MQLEQDQHLPGYDQTSWVRVQRYDEREWPEVLGLWFALNEHIVWTIAHVEKSASNASRRGRGRNRLRLAS